jgi:hypothetical protein
MNSLGRLSLFMTECPQIWRIGSFPRHRFAGPAAPSPPSVEKSFLLLAPAPAPQIEISKDKWKIE